MDDKTLEKLAILICGDGEDYPVYRKGNELTQFFDRANIEATHDGSTRKKWTFEILKELDFQELKCVIERLSDPKEYSGDVNKISSAVKILNEILYVEGYSVNIEGTKPKLKKVIPNYDYITNPKKEKEPELKQLPPPDFDSLDIESGVSEILKLRWEEVQKCIDSKAFLSSIIMMGSLLEGFMLGIIQKNPKKANQSKLSPKDSKTNSIKKFWDWKLSEMIDVAHDVNWIDLDVKKFSHVLREFRNLIHPYQQMLVNTFPDEDTCKISWLVVQAACNDISKNLTR